MHRRRTVGLKKGKTIPKRLSSTTCSALVFWAMAILVIVSAGGLAGPAAPTVFTLKQPNGTTFEARVVGDEWHHWTETVGGYTIVRDAVTGTWVYAERAAGGELVGGRQPVGEGPPTGVDSHVRPAALPRAPLGTVGSSMPGVSYAPPTQGIHNVLVLVVDFTPSELIGTTPTYWNDAFFGSAGSVADHYDEITYGQIALAPAVESDTTTFGGVEGAVNDGIVYVQLGYGHPNTGGSTGNANRQLVHDAIVEADGAVDYSLFDSDGDGFLSNDELHVVTVVAGCETSYGLAGVPNVWAHHWSLGFWYDEDDDGVLDPGENVAAPTVDGVVVGHYSGGPTGTRGGYSQVGEWHGVSLSLGHPATIGVISHELGHDLASGVPDLYDTDGSSIGIGNWCLQASGSWNRTSQLGDTPAHWCAWAKWYLGLLTPTQITTDTDDISFPRVEDAAGANRGVFQVLDNPNGVDFVFWGSSGTGEYFLLENRQQVGYDAGLPGSGLCIWHIYEAAPTNNTANDDEGSVPPGNPRLVVMEQMDGDFDLEGYGNPDGGTNRGDATDPWFSPAQFDDTSTPGSRLYDGSSTWVNVADISASGATMTADVSLSSPGADTAAVFRVDSTGDVFADGTFYGSTFQFGSADVAEWVDVSEPVEPGDVLELDPDNPGAYRKAQGGCSSLIAGVVSTAPGIALGSGSPVTDHSSPITGFPSPVTDHSSPTSDHSSLITHNGQALLALIGIVPVKACNEGGSIEPGDLLVSSSTPGYVKRWESSSSCTSFIGKALEPLAEGEGLILVLLMM